MLIIKLIQKYLELAVKKECLQELISLSDTYDILFLHHI